MKNLNNHPWLLFIIGILIGLLIFYAYNYYQNNNTPAYQENQEPLATFEIGPHNHLQGNYNAPIQLVVFNDFTCPYCQEYAQNLDRLLETHSDDVLIVWKHFPLNPDDLTPAIASECADEQGRFWAYAQGLYTYQDHYANDFLVNLASQLNLDEQQFSICLNSDQYQAKVQADYFEGIVKGVIGAPASFVNGQYIPGAIPLARLIEIVEQP